MKSIDAKLTAVFDQGVRLVLRRLHAEAGRELKRIFWKYLPYLPRMLRGKKSPGERLERTHDLDFLAYVRDPANGFLSGTRFPAGEFSVRIAAGKYYSVEVMRRVKGVGHANNYG